MPLYKRVPFSFFTIEDDEIVDVGALLQGRLDISKGPTQFFALSPITAAKSAISSGELALLQRIPADRWSTEGELRELGAGAHQLEELVRRGLLVSDGSAPEASELRRRAELLDTHAWHPYAAFYHFMTRGTEYESELDYGAIEAEASTRAQRHVAEHGAPPEPFHKYSGLPMVELPQIEKEGELYELLKRRRTSRAFDTTKKLSVENLSTLLYYTFGCHGYFYLAPEVLLLHRTSPSGGSLHPVEAYVLTLRVEGMAPGIYHYNMHDHGLECIREYDLEEAEILASEFGSGQKYMSGASVIFVMAARFYRSLWKYRRSSREYRVSLLDVAHLSQTLYLIATELNLGVFFSAAIHSSRIDEVLHLDGYKESALALCGCGIKPASSAPDYSLKFRAFTPRKTKLT